MAVRGISCEGYFVKTKAGYMYRLPVGTYQNGYTKYKTFSGKTKKEVRDRKDKYLEEEKSPFHQKGAMLLKDFLHWWLKTCKKDPKEVRPQTYTRMCAVVDYQIIPYLGEYKLIELDKATIQSQMVNRLITEINPRTGQVLSASTVNKAIIHLKDALNEAVDNGYILSNPCRNIKLPRNVREDAAAKRIRFFSDDEIQRFVETALSKTKNGYSVYEYGAALVLDLYTGLRIGELMGLRKKDISLTGRTIHVRENSVQYFDMDADSPTYHKTVSTTADKLKTKNGARNVPLSTGAFVIAKRMLQKCSGQSENLLSNRENSQALYSNILRSYKTICAKAGIENPGGVHTLRHTCASLLFRTGVEPKTISTILGHSSVQFTCDTYIHVLDEQTSEAMEQISQAWAFTDGEDLQKNVSVVSQDDADLDLNAVLQFLSKMNVDADVIAKIQEAVDKECQSTPQKVDKLLKG